MMKIIIYLQKVIIKNFLLASWSLTKEQDPEPDPSIRYGFADPDPIQNVTDPEHCRVGQGRT
jgi:hypothetical protein